MSTKSDIQTYLNNKYTVQKTESNTSLSGDGANFYDSTCIEWGAASDGTDICLQRRVTWVVYDEGGAGEKAAVYKDIPENQTDKSITSPAGSLLDEYKIAHDVSMIKRIQSGMIYAARNVVNEDDATTNHTERVKLAIDVIKNPDSWINAFASYVGANATIQSAGGSASDSDIEYVCASEFPWDDFAISIYGV
jgi:hypothetical protein